MANELEEFGFRALPGDDTDEESSWGAVSNLDVFFTSMYRYFKYRGLAVILVDGFTNIITLGFTVQF